jgi:hypothetical protein
MIVGNIPASSIASDIDLIVSGFIHNEDGLAIWGSPANLARAGGQLASI